MKELILAITCICFSFLASSQVQLQDPLSGKVLQVSKYAGINGSPFLIDDWARGKVITPKGVYSSLYIKYDAFSSTLFFRRNDESYEFSEPVDSFVILQNNRELFFVKGLEAQDLRREQFVEVLCKGKITLYKSVLVFMTEVNKVNEGIIKSFNKSERLYLARDGKLDQLRSGKKEFLSIFGDGAQEMETFATSNGLSFRKTDDLVKMVTHYNESIR